MNASENETFTETCTRKQNERLSEWMNIEPHCVCKAGFARLENGTCIDIDDPKCTQFWTTSTTETPTPNTTPTFPTTTTENPTTSTSTTAPLTTTLPNGKI